VLFTPLSLTHPKKFCTTTTRAAALHSISDDLFYNSNVQVELRENTHNSYQGFLESLRSQIHPSRAPDPSSVAHSNNCSISSLSSNSYNISGFLYCLSRLQSRKAIINNTLSTNLQTQRLLNLIISKPIPDPTPPTLPLTTYYYVSLLRIITSYITVVFRLQLSPV
jgi:hypothetical protein